VELVELACRNCGGRLSPDDFSERLKVIRCQHCQSIYALKSATPPSPSSAGVHEKPTVEMPRGFSVVEDARGLQIIYRWFSAGFVFLLFFAITWNAILVGWHSMAFAAKSWFMSVFSIVHTGVGVGLAYIVLCGFVNQTIVSVRDGKLTVRHTPLPWPGNTALDARSLKQLYAKEKVVSTKKGQSYHYALYAIDDSGTRRVVLKKLTSVEQAVFLEQQIERFLQIEDRAVSGEASV